MSDRHKLSSSVLDHHHRSSSKSSQSPAHLNKLSSPRSPAPSLKKGDHTRDQKPSDHAHPTTDRVDLSKRDPREINPTKNGENGKLDGYRVGHKDQDGASQDSHHSIEPVSDHPRTGEVDRDDDDDQGPLVDMETFGQLLEMDDDEEHSFSKSLTWDYFDQAVTTFQEMDTAVSGGDLITLSRKGHFLKGSSAALGLNRVKASCEKMQHFGNKKKANGEGILSEAEAMDQCKSLLKQLKDEQKLSKAWLERFYAERNL